MDSRKDISTDDTLAARPPEAQLATAPTLGIDEAAGHLESAETLDAGGLTGDRFPGAAASPGMSGAGPRYVTERELGQGGMGRVTLVFDSRLRRRVALKEFLPDPAGRSSRKSDQSAAQVNRFLREVQLSGCLEHPSIVPVHDFDEKPDGSVYYTMRYVEGRSLSDALKECTTPAQRLHYLPNFRDICNAMAYAHARGIIHRDLKPANVVLGTYGETIVIDWGLAKILDEAGDADRRLAAEVDQLRHGGEADRTVLGTALGTPHYMSPEQALGRIEEVDHQSDIYSLGAILYEILTGAPPFVGGSVQRVLMRTVEEPLTPVRSIAPEAPLELVAIAEKALAKEKPLRYDSCDRLAQDVTAHLSGEKVSSYSYSSWELLRRFIARNRIASSLVLLVFLILAAGVVLINGARRRSMRSERAAIAARRASEEDRKRAQEERVRADQARGEAEERERQVHEQLSRALTEKAERHLDERDFLTARVFAAAALLHSPHNPFGPHRHPVLPAQAPPEDALNLVTAHSLLFQATAFEPATFVHAFSGHRADVNAIAVSADGRLLASGGNDESVKLWDLGMKTLLSTFPEPRARILSLDFSPDGRLLACGDSDGGVHLLDPGQKKLMTTLRGHDQVVFSVRFSGDGRLLASGSGDRSVVLWDVPGRRMLHRLTGHADSVNAVSFAPDGRVLASASLDRTVRLWDVGGPARKATLTAAMPAAFTSLAFSPDGRILAGGDDQRAITLWDPGRAAPLGTLVVPGGPVASLAFSPDGRQLASSTTDRRVLLWNLPGKLGAVLTATDAPSSNSTVVFTRDGRHLVTGGDADVRLWARSVDRPISVFSGHEEQVFSVSISPDGRRMASCGQDRTVRLWDIPSGRPIAIFSGHQLEVWSVVFSPDGKFLATGGRDRTVRVWDIERREAKAVLSGHQGSVMAVAFSPDSVTLASSGFDRTVRLWNLGSQKQQAGFVAHGDAVVQLAFSRDGRWLVTGSWDKTVKLWDSRTLRLTRTIDVASVVTSISPGRTLAIHDVDGTLGLWDPESGTLQKELQLDRGMAVLSPDERHLLMVGNGQVRLLERDTGRCLQRLRHRGETYPPAFSMDGGNFAIPVGNDVWLVPVSPDHWRRDPAILLREAEAAAGMRLEGSRLVPTMAKRSR